MRVLYHFIKECSLHNDNVLFLFALSVKGEYCSKDKFNATCASDEVLLMHSAKFGRMRFGKCMKEDHGHVGCSADVLMHLDGICSGRQSCSLDIQDETLQKLHPCPKELMSFLEAEYSCVPGKRIFLL